MNGKVVDEEQSGIEGVNIVTDRNEGTSTDQSGRFSLVVAPGTNITLTFSHISYATESRVVSAGPSENLLLNIQLTLKSELRQEVEIR